MDVLTLLMSLATQKKTAEKAEAAAEAAQNAADIATAAISTQTGFAMSDNGDHLTFVITQS